MTARYIYPRLDDATALSLRSDLQGMKPSEGSDVAVPLHPAQYYAATGGTRVPEKHLQVVRETVIESTLELLNRASEKPLTRSDLRALDRRTGRVLEESMGIIPSDAAHDGVWSFMTLVLLPDVALARFPDLPVPRALGRPRNVLRRVWWRQHVLGDLADPPPGGAHEDVEPLGEDELVQLFERPSLASDARLVRRLATRALEHDAPDRSHFVRRLAKRVLAETAHLDTAVMNDIEIDDLISSCADPAA